MDEVFEEPGIGETGECSCAQGDGRLYEEPYIWSPEYQVRVAAAGLAKDVMVAVNNTTAWAPIDTTLMDLFYDFLMGKSTVISEDTPEPASDG